MTYLDVSGNPMSAAARKAIELEFVFCRMRNPTVTEIHAPGQVYHGHGDGFDDQDAIKIGEGLRYAFQ